MGWPSHKCEGSPSTLLSVDSVQEGGKIQKNVWDLACQGLNLLTLDGASFLLGRDDNIAEASCLLIPLLASQALPYDKVLNWLQFA